MSIEVHLDGEGATHPVGVLHSATRGASVTFEYFAEWLARPKAFAIDPTKRKPESCWVEKTVVGSKNDESRKAQEVVN